MNRSDFISLVKNYKWNDLENIENNLKIDVPNLITIDLHKNKVVHNYYISAQNTYKLDDGDVIVEAGLILLDKTLTWDDICPGCLIKIR